MAPSTIFTEVHEARTVSPAAEVLKISSTAHFEDLPSALAHAKARFLENNPNSLILHEKAVRVLPGGNTRTLLYTTPFPLSMRSGSGYQVTDEDGHTYTDFVAEMTAALYGHSQPVIQKAIRDTISTIGLNLGATTHLEAQYASLLCSRFSLDKIRFCNSGTEATLHALAAARKFTGKRKIVVFGNGYHGAVFSFPNGVAGENNVDLADWVIARYNDVDSAREAIGGDGVAAVIVEGMQGSGGSIPGTKDFLLGVEAAAKDAGVLFILDEVMTSRLSPGGIAEIVGLKPDLKTFGKYLGAGLAFGAFGGRDDVMSVFDPRISGTLAHSGTFNNNTMVMACGHAALSQVYTPAASKDFNALGSWMMDRLNEVAKGTKLSFTGVGTILCAHFTETGATRILRAEDVKQDWELKDLFWMEMIEAGFWINRRGSVALILGTPKSEVERFVSAVQAFLMKYSRLVHL